MGESRSVKVTSHTVYRLACPKCHQELRDQVTLKAWKRLPSSFTCSHCHVALHIPDHPEGGPMVWTRDRTLDLFRMQLHALQSQIVRPLSKYVLEVQIKGKKYVAVVEGYSHEYYTHRIDLNPLAEQIDLVICYRHNSCVRQRVLELCSPSGREYETYSPPKWFDIEQRGGKAWAMVFTGALLAGHGEAYKTLEQIREESPSAYYRYRRKTAELSAHKQGHPVAV